jgi:hypothetical protein
MTTRILIENIELPGDMRWEDEFATPVVEAVTPLLSGVRYIEESVLPSGRPVTLKLTGNARVSRTTVEALQALLTPGRTMTLTLADDRTFSVRWRHRDGALKAPVLRWRAPADAFVLYDLEIYLETA